MVTSVLYSSIHVWKTFFVFVPVEDMPLYPITEEAEEGDEEQDEATGNNQNS